MTAPTLPIDKLTRVFVKIRDARAELSAEFKRKDEELGAQMDELKRALLDYCKEQNVESVRTDAGLVYRTVKTRYWTSDWESMHKFIVDNAMPELLEKRINQSAVKALLEENAEMLPPGMNVDSEYTITVRKK
jgi:hypothetical protein